jgi:hypothetical protein
MFYTPGWGVIIGVGGTVAGVTITQAVNSALTWRTTRRERHQAIRDAATDLIATGSAWVYAASSQEQDLLRDVATHVPEEQLMATLTAARDVLYKAQLEFARALARVRIECPKKVVAAAEAYRASISDFEQTTRNKGEVVLRTRSVAGIEASTVEGTVPPQARLVEATRKAT